MLRNTTSNFTEQPRFQLYFTAQTGSPYFVILSTYSNGASCDRSAHDVSYASLSAGDSVTDTFFVVLPGWVTPSSPSGGRGLENIGVSLPGFGLTTNSSFGANVSIDSGPSNPAGVGRGIFQLG